MKAHNNYMQGIISPEAKQNHKKFWSFNKAKKQESSGMSPLRNEDGLIQNDPMAKTDILNEQTSSGRCSQYRIQIPSFHDREDSQYIYSIATPEVKKLLDNIKPHKDFQNSLLRAPTCLVTHQQDVTQGGHCSRRLEGCK